MPRPKHSVAKSIDSTLDPELQMSMALLGKLRDDGLLYEAIALLRDDNQLKGFYVSQTDSTEVVDAKQTLLRFVLDALYRDDPGRIRRLADLIELRVPVSPLDAFLISLRENHADWETRKKIGKDVPEEESFWEGWPFSLSELLRLYQSSRPREDGRRELPTNDIKNVADRLGVPFTSSRGRPQRDKAAKKLKD